MNQFSEEVLSIITDLEVAYSSATDMADRKSDKQLLDEFGDMLEKLTQMDRDREYGTEHNLHTPYLQIGTSKQLCLCFLFKTQKNV